MCEEKGERSKVKEVTGKGDSNYIIVKEYDQSGHFGSSMRVAASMDAI